MATIDGGRNQGGSCLAERQPAQSGASGMEQELRRIPAPGTMLALVYAPEFEAEDQDETPFEPDHDAQSGSRQTIEMRAIADKIWIWEQEQFPIKGPKLRLRKRGYRPQLNIGTILDWADAHHQATGCWPTVKSGRVRHSPYDETWNAIQSALNKGLRGLAGGSSLARILAEHRDVRPALSIERILVWADHLYAAQGRWPTQTSGPVLGAYRENWGSIADDLRQGRRGLPGGMTLARVLAEHRNVRNLHSIPPLSVDQILDWADAHHAAHGRWPSFSSGPVGGAPGETWSGINSALYEGWRGLHGASTLFRLLIEHRGSAIAKRRSDLSVDQILAWADAHRAVHGRWPVEDSGPLAEAPGECWSAISQALARGARGLPGGSSLARLLAEHRNARNPKNLPHLTPGQILVWADAYHAASGRWPSANSGALAEAPGEDWKNIDQALKKGHRGLGSGSSLARLLAEHRPSKLRILTLDMIQQWAEAHRRAHGRWPDACAGPVDVVPGESWSAINTALRHGRRGLPSGLSLSLLFDRGRNTNAAS